MLRNLWNLLRNNREEVIRIKGELCYIRPLVPQDARDLTNLLIRNINYWTKFEPRHNGIYYTEYTQQNKILDSMRLRSVQLEYLCGIYDIDSNTLIGQISLYAIKRLPFSSCFIGYALDEQSVGRGITSEAVQLMVHFAFEHLQINRVEAYVSPQNTASIRVLEKTGFLREGLLKELLYINGYWEDHYLYAITKTKYETDLGN